MTRIRKDLTNKRFGKLTALYVDEEKSKNGKVYWVCKCDCGKIKTILSTSLTRKNRGTKSCGCARNSSEAREKAIKTHNSFPSDITGLRLGRLVVVGRTNIKSTKTADNEALLWECLCDCGKTCYFSRYSLITPEGNRSCGCLYKDSRETTAKKYNKYDLTTYDFGVGYCENGSYFFFDKEDYEKIKDYYWNYNGDYVSAHSLKKDKYTTAIVRLHRVVMDVNDRENIEIDHKNLVRYDCRKINLRKATRSENSMNKNYLHLSSTGITGVRKEGDKWTAHIIKNKKTKRLGTFNTIEEAAEARLKAEIKYFGEFRFDSNNKNKIDENDFLNYATLQKCS